MQLFMFTVSADTREFEFYDGKIGLLSKLGIVSEDILTSEKIMTRGEFVNYVFKLINGNVSSGAKSVFWDVSDKHEYVDVINTMYSMGCISGGTDGSFRPNEAITKAAAVKILCCLLGYGDLAENEGGFPLGYYTVSKNIGLISRDFELSNDALDSLSFVNLMYDALNLPIAKVDKILNSINDSFVTYSNNTDETLLSIYYGIYGVYGMVEATPVSALYNLDSPSKKSIKVSGEVYYTDDTYVNELLGYNVICFYKNEDSKKEIVYVYPRSGYNTITTIDVEDIIGFENDVLMYSQNSITKRVDFGKGVYIIYNGKALDFSKYYNSSLFEFEDGYVELISNDNDSRVDVVKIKSYNSMVVGSTDTVDKKIYDKYSGSTILDLDNDNITVQIKDTLGQKVEFSDIEKGKVISYTESKDKLYYEIIVSYDYVDGLVNSKYDYGDKTVLVVNDVEYSMLEQASKTCSAIKPGSHYVLYLNHRGYVVALTEQIPTDYNMGYLLFVQKDSGLSNEIKLRLIDSNTVQQEYLLNKKAIIDGDRKDTDEVMEYFKPQGSSRYTKMLIRYKLNDAGEIVNIDTPTYNEMLESKDTLRLRYSGDSVRHVGGNDTIHRVGTYTDRAYSNMFGMTGTIFSVIVPPIENGESDIEPDDIVVYAMLNTDISKDYPMELYSIGEETPLLSAVVVNGGDASSTLSDEMYIVKKKSIKIDSDGNEYRCLTLTYKNDMEVFVSEDLEETFDEDDSTSIGLVTTYDDINIGDVVRCYYNFKGIATKILKVYDYNEKKCLAYTSTFSSRPRIFYGIVVYTENLFASIAVNTNNISEALVDGKINTELLELHYVPSAIKYRVHRNVLTTENVSIDSYITYKPGVENTTKLLLTSDNGSYKLNQVIMVD